MNNEILNEIKNIDLVTYIESQGYSVRRNGTDSAIPSQCPFCGKKFKDNAHFVIHLSKNKFKVYGAGCSVDEQYGTIIDFVMNYNCVDFAPAVGILKEYANISDSKESKTIFFDNNIENNEKKKYNFNEIVSKSIADNNDYSYFEERGLSLDTIKRYNLITNRKGLNNLLSVNKGDYLYFAFGYLYHYFIPLRDVDGTIVSFISRANDSALENAVNQSMANGSPLKLKKTHNLKGTEMIPFNIECCANLTLMQNNNDKRIFLCEGVFDALSFLDANKNAISSNSANNYNKVLTYITQFKDNLKDYIFYLCGDDDLDGQHFNRKLQEGLDLLGLKSCIFDIPYGYHDINDLYIQNKELFLYCIDGIKPVSATIKHNTPIYDVNDMDDNINRRNFNQEKESCLSVGYTMESNIAASSPAAMLNDLAASGMHVVENASEKNYLARNNPEDLLAAFDFISTNEVDYDYDIKTGFKVIDDVLPYLDGTIITLGAIPGAGKSTFCLNLAVRFAKNKIKVIFYSLELDWYFVYSKILSSLTATESFSTCFIDANKIHQYYVKRRKGLLNNEEKANLREVIKYYSENIAPFLHIDDFINRRTNTISDRTIEAIVAHTTSYIVNNVKEGESKPIVFVDYVQQVETEISGLVNDKQRIDYISKKLIDMKKLLGITTFLISSLNRDSYYDVISEISFKESGALEYGSDYVLGLQMRNMAQLVAEHTPKEVKEAIMKFKNSKTDFKQVELILVKNRNGAAGITMPLRFYGKYQSFSNGDEPIFLFQDSVISPIDLEYQDPFNCDNNESSNENEDNFFDRLGNC